MLVIVGSGTKMRPIHTGGALGQNEKVPSKREAVEALVALQKLNFDKEAPEHADVLRRYVMMR